MTRRCRPTMLLIGLCLLTGLALSATMASEEKEVSFVVRLCEGDDARPVMGDEALDNWDDCSIPLVDVPVRAAAGESAAGPEKSGEDGIVRLGPLVAPDDAEARLGVACTTHRCLTLRLPVRFLDAGDNYVLYRTPRHKKEQEDRP